jgi:aminoglycoside phosphotransferase (APT) family kinase protein
MRRALPSNRPLGGVLPPSEFGAVVDEEQILNSSLYTHAANASSRGILRVPTPYVASTARHSTKHSTANGEEMLNVERLKRWFVECHLTANGRLTVTLISGGRSNLTYRIEDEAGHHYVLRRPPMGSVLPSAHDVFREYRITAALSNTAIPVAKPYRFCDDVGVLGAPFYVMDLISGVVLSDDADGAQYPELSRTMASKDLIDVLANIHSLDVDQVGLGDLSRRDHYLDRQLKRWHMQFHSDGNRDLPLVDELHRHLVEHQPEQTHTGLVHGDYRLGNVIVRSDGELAAVLDWELATLGDTAADLGWLLATWREPGEPFLVDAPTGHSGFKTRDELKLRYSEVTGSNLTGIDYYVAFALWKLACINEGIYQRYMSGAMADDGFDAELQKDQVRLLAMAAAQVLW